MAESLDDGCIDANVDCQSLVIIAFSLIYARIPNHHPATAGAPKFVGFQAWQLCRSRIIRTIWGSRILRENCNYSCLNKLSDLFIELRCALSVFYNYFCLSCFLHILLPGMCHCEGAVLEEIVLQPDNFTWNSSDVSKDVDKWPPFLVELYSEQLEKETAIAIRVAVQAKRNRPACVNRVSA